MADDQGRSGGATLEIEDDIAFHRRMWGVQRAGWVVLTLIVVAALLGALGDGPLSAAQVSAGDDLEVHYARFERHRSPSTLTVEVSADHVRDGTVDVWVDRAYADGLLIEDVSPEPQSVADGDRVVVYTFEVDDDDRRVEVSIDLMPQALGVRRARVGVVGGPSVSFRQVVWP